MKKYKKSFKIKEIQKDNAAKLKYLIKLTLNDHWVESYLFWICIWRWSSWTQRSLLHQPHIHNPWSTCASSGWAQHCKWFNSSRMFNEISLSSLQWLRYYSGQFSKRRGYPQWFTPRRWNMRKNYDLAVFWCHMFCGLAMFLWCIFCDLAMFLWCIFCVLCSGAQVNKFQMAYCNLLKSNMDGLKKQQKKQKTKKATLWSTLKTLDLKKTFGLPLWARLYYQNVILRTPSD